MAKNAVADWDTTASNNTDIGGINIAEGCAPSNMNDAARTLMAQARVAIPTGSASIASAATTDLSTAYGLVHITGTTAITALGTAPAGAQRTVVFDGSLTLTHNATSLILPGAANIQTAAGDSAELVSEGSGNWRCTDYSKTSGLDAIYPRLDGANAGPLSVRNRIIDGRFDRWDESTSISASGYGAATMWRLSLGAGAAGTLSRVAGPDDRAPYAARATRTTVGTSSGSIRHRMESARTLAGRNARFGLMARASVAFTATLDLLQVFGTGGSPSTTVDVGGISISVGTTWAQVGATFAVPSVAGMTFGTNGDDYLEARISMPTAAGNIWFEMAMVQLAEGTVDTPFEWYGEAVEGLRVDRYWCKSYDRNTTPGTVTTNGSIRARTVNGNSQSAEASIQFRNEMRAVPTITMYSPNSGASGKCYDRIAAADVSASPSTIGTTGVTLSHSVGAPTGDSLTFHYTADARL